MKYLNSKLHQMELTNLNSISSTFSIQYFTSTSDKNIKSYNFNVDKVYHKK